MKLTQTTFGSIGSQKIHCITASNENGMSASFINYGATLISMKMPDKRGHIQEITLGYDNINAYADGTHYFGATTGRFANRIKNGQFRINNKTYQLACNENGTHHLHGGNKGFNKVVWDMAVSQTNQEASIQFTYLSKDGQEGYPGNLNTRTTYIFNDKNQLIIDYLATTDAPTPINLTNHTYWNLSGINPDKYPQESILNHQLKINADTYLSVDDELIPTGEFKPVLNTPFDFLKPQTIDSRIQEIDGLGYDHCYVLNTKGKIDIPAANICDTVSGRSMEVFTTKPGVQLYTGNFLTEPHTALCIETQYYPNCVNMKNFQETILLPGQEYRHKTIHAFKA